MSHIEDYKRPELATNEDIKYFVMTSKLPLINIRDCLVKVQKKRNYPEPGQHTYAYNHFKDDKFPENQNDLIRTDTYMIGYKF